MRPVISSLEALECFREDPEAFDLLLTDVTMPGITGDRLAQEVLAIRPDIPILLCTGFSEKIDRQKAKHLGIKGFLRSRLSNLIWPGWCGRFSITIIFLSPHNRPEMVYRLGHINADRR